MEHKKYIFIVVFFFPINLLFSQGDNCNVAGVLTTYSSVCTPTAGNTYSATSSGNPTTCGGTADDDIWYRFTTAAGSNYAFISVAVASSGFDPVAQVYNGAAGCGGLANVACANAGGNGIDESFTVTVNPSTTYYTRIYGYGSGDQYDGAFNICVFNAVPPSNDNCAGATTLTPGATCALTPGTSAWGTTSGVAACTGNPDDDVWYQFTANATYERIRVVPNDGNFDAVVQVFSRTGVCTGLASIQCQNTVGSGGTEDFYVSGLTNGNVYYIRVYHFGSYYGANVASGGFNICVQGGAPPANDNCAAAVNLPANASCITTSGSSTFATPSGTGAACGGQTNDDDVWYSFTAINYNHLITVTPNANMDAQVQILEGACPGGFLSKQCQDVAGIGGIENVNVISLTIGNTYYVRVSHKGTYYGFGASPSGAFTICNVATAPVGGSGLCDPIVLPSVNAACTYGTYDNSAMPTGSSELPAGCNERTNGNRRQMWFKFVVPENASGKVSINVKGLTGNIVNPTVSAFSWNGGACGTLTNFTLIGCNDDFCNVNYDCSWNSVLNLYARTPGETIYFKVSSATVNNGSGTFKLCVSAPINDYCTLPTFVCDLNGFEGTTSAGYTIDNAGLQAGDGGPFGGQTIENNSWLQFEASATTATITITVSECFLNDGAGGGYQYDCCGGGAGFNGGGLQAQVLAKNAGTCGAAAGWTAVSDYLNGVNGTNCGGGGPGTLCGINGTYNITATPLTIGQSYYIMFDGFAGDVCNYKINGATGVGTTVIVTPASSTVEICSGNTTTISIDPIGVNASVAWTSSPAGYTGSGTSITVNPAVSPGVANGTVTYLATVTGNCVTPQTVPANVIVNKTPNPPAITPTPTNFCGYTVLTGSASDPDATTYEWFDAPLAGTSLYSGPNYVITVPNNTVGTYNAYVAAYNSAVTPACTSATRSLLSVPINTFGGKIKWTGTSTSAWNNTANWGGCMTDCSLGALIPASASVPFSPSIGAYTATVKDLEFEAATSTLTLAGTSSILELCGNFIHNGTLNIAAGTPDVKFNGTTAQYYLKTASGSGDLPDVIIDNGAGVTVIEDVGYQDLEIQSTSTLTLVNGIIITNDAKKVNIKNSASAALIGFSETSYISGALKRATSGAYPKIYDFPVGNLTSYQVATLNFTAGTTISSATMYFENPSNSLGTGWPLYEDGGEYLSPLVNVGGAIPGNEGVWTIISSTGTANYELTLNGTNFSNQGTDIHSILKRNQYLCPTSDWSLIGSYVSSSIIGGTISVKRDGMTGFSQFGIGRRNLITDFYWVGGIGSWADPSHWSSSSGGLGGVGTPTINNNVHIDDNSGTDENSPITVPGPAIWYTKGFFMTGINGSKTPVIGKGTLLPRP